MGLSVVERRVKRARAVMSNVSGYVPAPSLKSDIVLTGEFCLIP